MSAIISCFVAFAVSAAAAAYYNLWNTNKKGQTDLWMWTCSHKRFEVSAGGTEFNFVTICQELVSISKSFLSFHSQAQTYVWYAGIAVAAIEALNLVACLYNTVKLSVVESKKAYGYTRVEK